MEKKNLSRREFLKTTGAGAVGAGILSQSLLATTADLSQAPEVDRKQLVAALADTLIPTADGYPGYKRLEQYGITDEVLKALTIGQADWNLFNAAAGEFFNGKAFLNLAENERAEFLNLIVASLPPGTYGDGPPKISPAHAGGLASKLDPAAIEKLQGVFRITRTRVFTVFYHNFPEDRLKRDKNKLPLLAAGDLHQIVNPNTKGLVTGWDIAGFPGPLSWEEEEERRAKWMKIRWSND